MIFQNLIYGLFIYEIKDPFFFFSEFKLGLKKRAQVHDEGVQICIAKGSKQFFKNIIYIYFRSGGSFEPPNYNVPPPL